MVLSRGMLPIGLSTQVPKSALSKRLASGLLWLGLWATGLQGSCSGLPSDANAAPESSEARYAFEQAHMGGHFRIQLYAATPAQAQLAAQAAFARVGQLDERLSDYRAQSELSRLGRSSDGPLQGQALRLSPELFRVLAYAQEVSQQTDGSFDVTVGPFVQLWRRARRQNQLPDPQRLQAAGRAVGHAKLVLDFEAQSATLGAAGMRLDLGGIAKGYVLDEALLVLAAHGIERALLDAGGDLLASGPPPGQSAWRVQLDPRGQAAPLSIALCRGALATSGDAYQFLELEGLRYSHIVDPKSGLGCTQRYAASVLAPSAMQADAWASALVVLGPERGLPLLEAREELEGCLFDATQSFGSRGFKTEVRPTRAAGP